MKFKHYVSFTFFSVFFSLMPVASGMAAELSAPQVAIADASDKLQQRMKDKGFIKDFNKVTQFVDQTIYPHVDFDKISALVLGKSWKTATPDEQVRFKKEFQTLLVRTYSRAFSEFKEWSIRFLPSEMEEGATKVIVKTEVLQPGVQPIAVNYRMYLNGNEWKAYDIMIEGVSLVTNYRTTFSDEIQTKGSLNAVIDNLAKRNADALKNS
ncbi:MAG TPA: toluene tolerance protein [Methylococcaceae bacterium]|nr:toluene tolerance protein [Methylococcaceae bacterium]